MKKNYFFSVTVLLFAVAFSTGCNSEAPAKEETAAKTENATVAETITNPKLSLAPVEYSELCEKSLQHIAKFEFDAWADMLADDVVYAFPDGDVDTRTVLKGKAAVVDWWKNWKATSGIESMVMSEFNHTPINVTAQINGGAPKGIYDIAYFSNKMVFSGNPVTLRMNFALHFNADKKIDRYTTYYDRSVIIKATGKNVLDESKTK